MKIKLYVTYKDGRKVAYSYSMKKTNPMSNCDFDYYVKIKRLSTVDDMFAVVETDDGEFVCRRQVKACWADDKYELSEFVYFGITICGDRIVHDTRNSLIYHGAHIPTSYRVEYYYGPDGKVLRDNDGSPKSRTIAIRNGSDHTCKKVNEDSLSPKIRKLMTSINSL